MLLPKPETVGINSYDFSKSLLNNFEDHFAPRLERRADTFRVILEEAFRKRRPLTIVETGCLRVPGNWSGDGQSTFLFDCIIAATGGSAYSVDIDPKSLTAASRVVSNVNLVLNDSVAFLNSFSRQIDILYLDSFDLDQNDPLPSSLHHIYELCAAQPWLTRGSVIAVDDTYSIDGKVAGKGVFVAEFMQRIGATQLAEGYQSVWMY